VRRELFLRLCKATLTQKVSSIIYINTFCSSIKLSINRVDIATVRIEQVENGGTQVGNDPTRGVTAEYPVSLRDEQVRAVLREDRRDETAMKKRLTIKLRKE